MCGRPSMCRRSTGAGRLLVGLLLAIGGDRHPATRDLCPSVRTLANDAGQVFSVPHDPMRNLIKALFRLLALSGQLTSVFFPISAVPTSLYGSCFYTSRT